jgi:ribosomal protein S18 acetylase RimI-like enzyme
MTAADHPWVVGVASDVFRSLGDYAQILPTWLNQPGVLGWVAQDVEDARLGFALLGFYLETQGQAQVPVADLLALAVEPAQQRRGAGSLLLAHVIAVASRLGPANQIHELRLTVAFENLVGRNLYLKHGFHRADAFPGWYSGGQSAVRMVLPLPAGIAPPATLPPE